MKFKNWYNYFVLLSALFICSSISLVASAKKKHSTSVFFKADSTVKTINSLEYDLMYHQSDPLKEDTSIMSVKCLLKFKVKHPIGAWHKLIINYESKKLGWYSKNEIKFDGKFVYRTWMDTSRKLNINPLVDVKRNPNLVFNGTHSGMFIPEWLRKEKFFTKYIFDESIISTNIENVEYNGISSIKVSFDLKNEAFSDLKEVYYFRKSDYLPIGYFCWFNIGTLPYYYGYDITYNHINEEIADSVFIINPKEVVPTESQSNVEIKNELVKEGTLAPDFTSKLNNDKTIQLSNQRGKIVILDFWYLSCPPCLKAIPQLVEIDKKYKDKDVMIVGINPFNESKHINGLFEKRGVKYFSTFMSKDIAELYGITGYPTTIIIDQLGKIHKIHKGWSEDYKKDIIKSIDELLD